MPFQNPIVAGLRLVREAIQSPNFVTGISGWFIGKDGSAEFQDVEVRGEIDVTRLTAAGTVGVMILEPNGPNGMPTFQFITASTPEDTFAGITAQNSISIPGGTRLDFTSTPYDSTVDGTTEVHQLMRVGPDFSGTFILKDSTGHFVSGFHQVSDDRASSGYQNIDGDTLHNILITDPGIEIVAGIQDANVSSMSLDTTDGVVIVGNSGGANNGLAIDSDGVRINGGDVFRTSASPCWKESFRPNVADFNNAAMADWIAAGFSAVPVPIWARDGTATAQVTIAVTAGIISAATSFNIRAAVGATAGDPVRYIAGAVPTQSTIVCHVDFPIPNGTTTFTPKLQAQRLVAVGALRATTGGSNNDPLVVVDVLFKK